MERPKLPTAAELRRANEAAEGGAERVLDLYINSVRKYEERLDEDLRARLEYQRHVQRYRYLSVACGTALALASLGLCAMGIWLGADLIPLTWVLGPVTALAGVFVWGYRPRSTYREISPPEPKRSVLEVLPEQPTLTE